RPPRLVLLVDECAKQEAVHGIESAERLIEDDEIGLVDDGRDELNLLRHALAELLALLPIDILQPDALQPLPNLDPHLPTVHSLQARHVLEKRPDPHFL